MQPEKRPIFSQKHVRESWSWRFLVFSCSVAPTCGWWPGLVSFIGFDRFLKEAYIYSFWVLHLGCYLCLILDTHLHCHESNKFIALCILLALVNQNNGAYRSHGTILAFTFGTKKTKRVLFLFSIQYYGYDIFVRFDVNHLESASMKRRVITSGQDYYIKTILHVEHGASQKRIALT